MRARENPPQRSPSHQACQHIPQSGARSQPRPAKQLPTHPKARQVAHEQPRTGEQHGPQRPAQRIAGVVEPMRARGSTLREIAEGLDKAGVPTARGGRWTAMQVKRVLDRLAEGQDA